MIDWDDAYAIAAYIKDADAYPDKWEERAKDWRSVENSVGRARLNIAYGEKERTRLDLFLPAGRPQGVVVFVHGGYWRRFNNKFWSHLAAGATKNGWAVCMPSYSLVPDVRISDITKEIAQAIEKASELVAYGRIVLAGHSAGGHLVSRMLCSDIALSGNVEKRLSRVVPISPISDLRPLLNTEMNADFRLDGPEANAESPMLYPAPRNIPVSVWVGSDERPAFLDQAGWLRDAWPNASLIVDENKHHFDVIDALADPQSKMTQLLIS